jgi:hypothetical protein
VYSPMSYATFCPTNREQIQIGRQLRPGFSHLIHQILKVFNTHLALAMDLLHKDLPSVLDSAGWDYMGGSLCRRLRLAGHVPRVAAPVSQPRAKTAAIPGLSIVSSLLRLPRLADCYYSGGRFGGHSIIMSTRKPGESASRDGAGSDGGHGRVNYGCSRHRSVPRRGWGCRA